MNRWMRLILLVSLGLNLGLGWAILRDGRHEGPRPSAAGRVWRERPAAGDSAGWQRMMDVRVERLASALDLDAAQTERLRQLQSTNGSRVRAQRQRIEEARKAVRDASGGGVYDPSAVRGALAGLRHAQADLDSLTQEFLMQELALMDPAQRERYLELLPLDPWRTGHAGGPGLREGGPGRGGAHRRRDQ